MTSSHTRAGRAASPPSAAASAQADGYQHSIGGDMMNKPSVLFVCVENSNRSQMARPSPDARRGHGRKSFRRVTAVGQGQPAGRAVHGERGYDLGTHSRSRSTPSTALTSRPRSRWAAGNYCRSCSPDRREDWNIPTRRSFRTTNSAPSAIDRGESEALPRRSACCHSRIRETVLRGC